MTILPVMVLCSALGFWRGALAAFLFTPLNIGLMTLAGESPSEFLNRIFWFSHFVLMIVGAAGGYLHDLRKNLRQELSDKKDLLSELQETERRYRSLFEGTNDAVLIIGLDHKILTVNQRASDMLGVSAHKIVSSQIYEFFSLEEWQRISEKIEKVQSGISLPIFESEFIHFNGHKIYTEVNMVLVTGDHFIPMYIQAVVRDISDRKIIEEKLRYMASHDPLTGLANRRLLSDIAEGTFNHLAAVDKQAAVLFVDFDGFKRINDGYGHEAGDDFLKKMAEQIKLNIREGDVAARLAGDEFVILLRDVPDDEDVGALAARILMDVSRDIGDMNIPMHITASVGISLFPKDADNFNDLLKKADEAMYQVKKDGKNGIGFYKRDA